MILAPSAADIVEKLGGGEYVVGVTASVREFPRAAKVGTHINPGLEKIASLKPTLIIATSRFHADAAQRIRAKLLIYEPKNLSEILEGIQTVAAAIEREEEGKALADSLRKLLEGIKPLKNPPTVVYEVRSSPLALAKKDSIIRSVLESAGMKYAFEGGSGAVSAEYILTHQPDYYLYQEGPMNKNPVPPPERPGWGTLQSCVWKVREPDFARANTGVFARAVEINRILNGETPCVSEEKLYNDGKSGHK